MPFIYCAKCETQDGRLCAVCLKGYHVSFHHKSRRYIGDNRNNCWIRLRQKREKVKLCESHAQVYAECDMCKTDAAAVIKRSTWGSDLRYAPAGWTENRTVGGKALLLCSSCTSTVDVGVDWAMEHDGYSLNVSVGMAFAFQLGQQISWLPWGEIGKAMTPEWLPPHRPWPLSDDQRSWTGQRFLETMRCPETFAAAPGSDPEGFRLRCTMQIHHSGPCAHDEVVAARWQMSGAVVHDDQVDAASYSAGYMVHSHLRAATGDLTECGIGGGRIANRYDDATCADCRHARDNQRLPEPSSGRPAED